MKTISLTDADYLYIVNLIKSEMEAAVFFRHECEYVLDHADCGNIDVEIQKKQLKEHENNMNICSALLKKIRAED